MIMHNRRSIDLLQSKSGMLWHYGRGMLTVILVLFVEYFLLVKFFKFKSFWQKFAKYANKYRNS